MIVDWLFGRQTRGEQRAHPSAAIDWGSFLSIGGLSPAGITVTEDNVLTSATVFACVRVLSQALASLPLLVYRRLPDGGKERASDHPLFALLHDAPNPEMTSFDFRQTLMAHALTWGNACAQIEFNRAGMPIALWPMLPGQTKLRRPTINGPILYDYYQTNAPVITLPADQVLHIRGLSSNGIIGYSPVRLAMQSFGLDMALENFGAAFFGHGARPSLVIKHPGKLSKDAITRLQQSFEDNWAGLDNAHRVQILEEGMTAENVGMPLDEAQFLETRKFERSVIAGWFGVPPHMIGDLERATFSNVQEQQKSFYQDTLRPWCANWEGALRQKLARGADRDSLVIEHLFNDILLSNPAERAAVHQTMTSIGLQTINEGRAVENLNPVDGGDVHLVPLNLTTLDQIGEAASADPSAANDSAGAGQDNTPADGIDPQALLDPLVAEVKRRIATRIATDVRQSGAKALRNGGRDAVETWLDGIEPEWRQALHDMMMPIGEVARSLRVGIPILSEWIDIPAGHALAELFHGDTANGKVAARTQPAETGLVDLAVLVAGANGRNGRGENHA